MKKIIIEFDDSVTKEQEEKIVVAIIKSLLDLKFPPDSFAIRGEE